MTTMAREKNVDELQMLTEEPNPAQARWELSQVNIKTMSKKSNYFSREHETQSQCDK